MSTGSIGAVTCRMGQPLLAIRVDGNREIGSGHVMRCCAVAHAAGRRGVGVRFLVSDEDSATMLKEQGFEAKVIGGDFRSLDAADVDPIEDVVSSVAVRGVLVDSYAATDRFLTKLARVCRDRGSVLAYIDDDFRFESGYSSRPVRLPVDVVINYGFAADQTAYADVYSGTQARLLIGPSFAPLRPGFKASGFEVADKVSSILVTTGSTNPDRTLERFASCCREAVPDAEVHVVVGRSAGFCAPYDDHVVLHHSPRDMRGLMLASDLVVSAAGTTLYELASLGVPTVAVPITENQSANITGWLRLGLGPCISSAGWGDGELVSIVRRLACGGGERAACSERLNRTCDGDGALRIVDSITGRAVN